MSRRQLATKPNADAISHDLVEELMQMGLGEDFVQTFLQECVRDIRRCLAEIRRTAHSMLWDECRDAHHALKGAAGNMGAKRLEAKAGEGMRASNLALESTWHRRTQEMESDLMEALAALEVRHIVLRYDEGDE